MNIIRTSIYSLLFLAACGTANKGHDHDHDHEGHDHAQEVAECTHDHDHDHEGHDHDHEGHNHHDHEAEGHEHNHEGHDHEAHSHDGHNHEGHNHDHGDVHGEDEHEHGITINPEEAKAFGVQTTTVEPMTFHGVRKVAGEIVAPNNAQHVIVAKSSGILNFSRSINPGQSLRSGEQIATISAKGVAGGDSNESAGVAVEAAKRELDRITPLFKDGIVSEKEYNAAKSAYDQALAGYSGSKSGSAVVSPAAGVIINLYVKSGEYVEAGQAVAAVSSTKRLMLKADLPERYMNEAGKYTSANIKAPYSDKVVSLSALNGRRTSEGSEAYATVPGYIPVYFSFDNDGSLLPGSLCEAYLITSSNSQAIAVPEEAIAEQMGQHFVYVKIDDEGYEKVPVVLGATDGKMREIVSGLTPGRDVVTAGVTFVKLAEAKNAVPQGHSHNH